MQHNLKNFIDNIENRDKGNSVDWQLMKIQRGISKTSQGIIDFLETKDKLFLGDLWGCSMYGHRINALIDKNIKIIENQLKRISNLQQDFYKYRDKITEEINLEYNGDQALRVLNEINRIIEEEIKNNLR